jgi:hypothetical protein
MVPLLELNSLCHIISTYAQGIRKLPVAPQLPRQQPTCKNHIKTKEEILVDFVEDLVELPLQYILEPMD